MKPDDPELSFQLCTAVASPHLFSTVLHTRFLAYGASGRLTHQKAAHEMGDEWDGRSVLVLASFEGVAVGSVRVTIGTRGESLSYPSSLDTERHLLTLPDPSDYVEPSRFCILPEFRGRGFWYPIAAQMVLLGLRTGRRFMVGSALDSLTPTWNKIGFRRLGFRYAHNLIGGGTSEMLQLDVQAVIGGSCDPTFFRTLQRARSNRPSEDAGVAAMLNRAW